MIYSEYNKLAAQRRNPTFKISIFFLVNKIIMLKKLNPLIFGLLANRLIIKK